MPQYSSIYLVIIYHLLSLLQSTLWTEHIQSKCRLGNVVPLTKPILEFLSRAQPPVRLGFSSSPAPQGLCTALPCLQSSHGCLLLGIRAGANTSPFGKEGLPALPHFFLPYCLGCNFHSQKLPCLFIDLVSFLSLSTTALSPVREAARLHFEVQ